MFKFGSNYAYLMTIEIMLMAVIEYKSKVMVGMKAKLQNLRILMGTCSVRAPVE